VCWSRKRKVLHLKLQYFHYLVMRYKTSPVTGLEWPRGFQEVQDSQIS